MYPVILDLGRVSVALVGDGEAAAIAFGAQADLEECLTGSLSRFLPCDSISCYSEAMGFARGCAREASISDRFCSEVPDSILTAADWMKAQCRGTPNEKACYKIYQPHVTRCLDVAV